jgi:hypothetical protein
VIRKRAGEGVGGARNGGLPVMILP